MAGKLNNFDYTQADLDAVLDNPELTAEDFANARPFAEVFPGIVAAIKRGRGRQKTPTKMLVSLRLDRDALNAFRASGAGWQSRINDVVVRASRKLGK